MKSKAPGIRIFCENLKVSLLPKGKKWEHQALLEYSTDYFDFEFLHLLFAGNGGTLVRALASHQFGLGSYPGVDALCGLSLVMVLYLVSRGFFFLVFPLSINTSISKFQFDQGW